MRLEKGVSSEEFDQDTTNTPDVAGEAPSEIQDDFRCPVVAGRDDRGVVFIIKGGRSEIDKSDFTVEEHTALPSVAVGGVGRRGDGAVVCEGLIGVANEEDVFGFEVSVDEV